MLSIRDPPQNKEYIQTESEGLEKDISHKWRPKESRSSNRKTTTYKGIPIRITADLSIETLQARREWQDILKVIKEKKLQPRLSTQQGSHSHMKEKSKALQTSKSSENSTSPNQLSNKC